MEIDLHKGTQLYVLKLTWLYVKAKAKKILSGLTLCGTTTIDLVSRLPFVMFPYNQDQTKCKSILIWISMPYNRWLTIFPYYLKSNLKIVPQQSPKKPQSEVFGVYKLHIDICRLVSQMFNVHLKFALISTFQYKCLHKKFKNYHKCHLLRTYYMLVTIRSFNIQNNAE